MIATTVAGITIDPQLAVVIDDDVEVRQLIVAGLKQIGMSVESFSAAKEAFASIDRLHPGIIFLDVALLRSDAIDVLRGLGERRYGGIVQLMSGGRQLLLDAVARIGVRHGLRLSKPLNKPLERAAILRAIESLPSAAALMQADQTLPQSAHR
jgi:FixJ family two-component response regulator